MTMSSACSFAFGSCLKLVEILMARDSQFLAWASGDDTGCSRRSRYSTISNYFQSMLGCYCA